MHAQTADPAREARALALLDEILSRPEFQWQEARQSVLERFWEWLLRQLFNLAPDAVGSGRLLTAFLAMLGLFITLALVGYVLSRLRRQVAPSAEPGQVAGGERPQNAEQAMARAQDVALQGDYRLAVRYLYLSSLLLLNERGLVNYDRTRTNLEYLHSVSHQPRLAATLREIVDTFDRSWYGLQAPDAKTYAEFRRRVQSLREFR